MSIDLTSVWYIARNGEMVWQGTAEHLRAWVASGGIQGNEAAWSEGFDAWVPVHSHERTQWIRDAVADRDQFTGEHTEFSQPQGTEALNLPTFIEEGDSPFAGPRPGRERRSQHRRRVTDREGHEGRAGRRGADRRVIASVGLPVGVLAGVVIGLGAAYLVWTQLPGSSGTSTVSQTPKPTVQPADAMQPRQVDAGKLVPTLDADPSVPAAIKAAQAASKPKSASVTGQSTKRSSAVDTSPSQAAQPQAAPEPKPTNEASPQSGAVRKRQPAQSQGIRIVKKKKKRGIELPSSSANRSQEINRSMQVRRAIWDACIRRAQRDYPTLTGRLIFSISVTKGGAINGVTGPSGNVGAQYAAGCLLGEFSNLTFPPGRAAQVKFPYTTP